MQTDTLAEPDEGSLNYNKINIKKISIRQTVKILFWLAAVFFN